MYLTVCTVIMSAAISTEESFLLSIDQVHIGTANQEHPRISGGELLVLLRLVNLMTLKDKVEIWHLGVSCRSDQLCKSKIDHPCETALQQAAL